MAPARALPLFLLALSTLSLAQAQGRPARGPLIPRLPRALFFPWTLPDSPSGAIGHSTEPLRKILGQEDVKQLILNATISDTKSPALNTPDSKPRNKDTVGLATSTTASGISGDEAHTLPVRAAAAGAGDDGARRRLNRRRGGRRDRRRGGRRGRRRWGRRGRRSWARVGLGGLNPGGGIASIPLLIRDASSASSLAASSPGVAPGPAPATDAPEPAPAPSVLLDPNSLQKFVDPLPVPPVLNGSIPGRVITLGMYKTQHRFHRDMPNSTVYSYGTSKAAASHPGPTIEALRGFNTLIQWRNHLEDPQHIFLQDPTIAQARPPQGGIPTVVHRHGGEQAPEYDGHPGAWFTSRGDTGPAFQTDFYNYTNNQYPAMMWYHDHTVGWTRLNVAAGLFGMFVLREPYGQESTLHLPRGKYEVPLAIEDKRFYANGSLWYPTQGVDPAHPVWVPDYIGDTIVVNGKAWPILEAERTAYRFRILGGSNSREMNLSFVCADSSDYPNFYLPLKGYNVPFYQIGTMGGFLNEPVKLTSLFLGVAERYDVIMDFSSLDPSCSDVIITNNAPDTYPIGAPADNNTGTVMRIHLNGNPSPPFEFPTFPQVVQPLSADNNLVYRDLDMYSFANKATRQPKSLLINGYPYENPPTERPIYGSQEIWNIISPLRVMHPIHIHLISFQVMYRRPINASLYTSNQCSLRNASRPSCYTGPAEPPLPSEGGWVDMVKAPPSYVTTIIMRFMDQSGDPFPFDPTTSPHYVWHCHIAEHEDNDMMRLLVVLPDPLAQINNRNDTRETALPPALATFP